jgi:hypothetical protein
LQNLQFCSGSGKVRFNGGHRNWAKRDIMMQRILKKMFFRIYGLFLQILPMGAFNESGYGN